MIYGPLNVKDTVKYFGKQVKVADSIKALKAKKYDIQKLSIDKDEDHPYNGYRYMEPLEEKTHLDYLIENLEYLHQVYSDCANSFVTDDEGKRQVEEILNELKYLLGSHNKVDFVTKLFPEYFDIIEMDTGRGVPSVEELELGNHSYKVTILVR